MAQISMKRTHALGAEQARGQIEQLVSLVDLPPTLLDACDIPVPTSMQGRSILPLLDRHKPTDWPREVFVQVSETEVGRAIRTDRWTYAVNAPDRKPYQDASSDRYVESHLYDLLADPWQLNNLVGSRNPVHVSARRDLRARLLDRMRAAGESVPGIDDWQPPQPA
ncbi:MAG TPA: hypothetical protein PKB10_09835 [Tepidisphaeraceae bacterium]|nr:hypothetical protein [Tepidisphaeraceae bacterium]